MPSPPASLRATFARLDRQFEEFERLLPVVERRAEGVSGWSVGEHLDHLLIADGTLMDAIETPSTEELSPFSTVGRTLLLLRWIPRGRGRAPKRTQPREVDAERLAAGVVEARDRSRRLQSLDARFTDRRPVAKHPYFGGMSVAQCWRFMEVHHHHHLKIVRDVLKRSPR